jgi:hypothetical protein
MNLYFQLSPNWGLLPDMDSGVYCEPGRCLANDDLS